MTVIMPPSAQDMENVREILRLCADARAMQAALGELRARINEHASELETVRAARREAEDAERRAQEIMRESETKTARLESREKELDEREKNVAAREGKLEVLRRKIA